MIPQGGTLSNLSTQDIVSQPSKTYRFDIKTGRIQGMADGLDAVMQAVYKILETPRYKYLIYTAKYGNELDRIIGTDPVFFRSKFTKMIQEALLQDDRITAVDNVQLKSSGDTVTVELTLVSTYGSFQIAKEVSYV